MRSPSEILIRLFACASLVMLGGLSEPGAEVMPPIGVDEGEMYPDFLLPTVDGDLKRLSDYRGKKILLFHFASW